MSKPQKYTLIPEKVFYDYVQNNKAYTGFIEHQDGRCSFVLPEVVVTTDVAMDMGRLSHFQLTPQIKHNICAVPTIPSDVIRVHMSPPERKKWKSSPNDPDPILGTDRNGVEKSTHFVKKGETIEMLSMLYGVKLSDLKIINGGKLPEEGKHYNIFPEVDFKNNPYGGYQNPHSSSGIIYDSSSLAVIVADFMMGGDGTCGARIENMIVTGGAREQIKNWDVVVDLVDDGIRQLRKLNCVPGTVIERPTKIPSILSYTWNSMVEHTKRDLGMSNKAKDFFSPVHYIGSFNLTMRVNADGKTATVALYDTKSVSSLLDNQFGNSVNITKGRVLETTYQRYIWTVTLKHY